MLQSFLTHQAKCQDAWRRHGNIAEQRLSGSKQQTGLSERRTKNTTNVSECSYQKGNEARLNGMRKECSVTYWCGVGWDQG